MTRKYEQMTKYVALQLGDAGQTVVGASNPIPGVSGYTTKSAVIAESASLSGEVDLEGYKHIAFAMPAAWTAAALTFAASPTTGGTFSPVYDDSGAEVTIPSPSATTQIACDIIALKLAPFRFIKVRSGTSASAVNQAAARTITLILKA